MRKPGRKKNQAPPQPTGSFRGPSQFATPGPHIPNISPSGCFCFLSKMRPLWFSEQMRPLWFSEQMRPLWFSEQMRPLWFFEQTNRSTVFGVWMKAKRWNQPRFAAKLSRNVPSSGLPKESVQCSSQWLIKRILPYYVRFTPDMEKEGKY